MQIELISAVAGLTGLVVAVGYYLLGRLKTLEADNAEQREKDLKAKEEELTALRHRVADLEEKQKRIPEMERQIATLVRQLEDQQKRLDATAAALDGKERELARLTEENAALKAGLREKTAEAQTLAVRVETYEHALQLVGGERRAPAHDQRGETPTEAEKEQETGRGTESGLA